MDSDENSESYIPNYNSSLIDEILALDNFVYNKKDKKNDSLKSGSDTKINNKIDSSPEDLLRRINLQETLSEISSDTVKKINIIPPPPKLFVPPPPPINPPPPPKEDAKDTIIDEVGSVFGLQINHSKKMEVITKMKKKNKNGQIEDKFVKFDELGITFYFDELGILDEITFSYPFLGATKKGLRIQDDVEKAISLYGKPKMRTFSGVIWSKVAVFLNDDQVTTIRLRSN